MDRQMMRSVIIAVVILATFCATYFGTQASFNQGTVEVKNTIVTESITGVDERTLSLVDVEVSTAVEIEEESLSQMLLSQSLVPANMHRIDIEDILRFQTWIFHNQNPHDCSRVRQQHFRGWNNGLGSYLQVIGNSFLRALLNHHVFILDYAKIDYVDPRRCPGQNYKCLFLPTTNCVAREFDLPIGASFKEFGPHICTVFDPITFTEEAKLSRVYPVEWYFREALRYLIRPNTDLRQFGEDIKHEIGLNKIIGKKGIGLKIRTGEDKILEIKQISVQKCVNLTAGVGMNWVNEIKHHCESSKCEYVFLSGDKDTDALEQALKENLPFDVVVMDSKYFVQQDLRKGLSAASKIKENMMQQRHEDSSEGIKFDEAMSLLVMMQIMAETRTVIGSYTSSMTRRVYDLLGMIEDNPASLFKEVDGLSYFTCWKDDGEWGLHKKNKEGGLEFDCLPPSLSSEPHGLSTSHSEGLYPEKCNVPKIPPPAMECGNVGFWYCPKSKVAYLPNPKVCSSTVRTLLKKSFNKTCAPMPPGTLHMIPKETYVFTVARNPLSRIFAAYREIDSHLLIHPYPEGLEANFIHMDRDNEPQRFRTFLDDIFTGRTGTNDFYTAFPAHAHPQYLVMCGAPHVNFTLHQESFNDDWLDLMEDMGPVHNRFLKPTQINVMNAGEKLRDRAGFEYALGFDSMTATVAFEKVHAGLHKFMTDSDYELICNYFKEDLDCFGYSCDYNSTALAEKAYEKLEKLEQARWLPESHKLPSQLILEHNLEHTMVVAQKRLEMAEKRMEHAQKVQANAEQKIVELTKTDALNLKKQALEKKAADKQKIVELAETDDNRKKQALVKQRDDLAFKKKVTAENEDARAIKKQKIANKPAALKKKAATEQKIVDSKKQVLVKQRTNLALKKKVTAGKENEQICRAIGVNSEMVAKSRLHGNTFRWHHAMNMNETIKIAILGGSVTAGHGCVPTGPKGPNHTCAWPKQLERMLNSYYSSSYAKIDNLAHGATPSRAGLTQVMSLTDYDIIIIHWTANDDNFKKFYRDESEEIKPVFETLVRTALALPKNPAVILFEGFGMQSIEPVAEIMHHQIASVYDIPIISARQAFWHSIAYREEIKKLKGVHVPSTFHVMFACLVFNNWIQESASIKPAVWFDVGDQPPVFGGSTMHCNKTFDASAFSGTLKDAPKTNNGWKYYADVPDKYGYISNSSKSILTFDVAGNPQDKLYRLLYIHYVKSYSSEWGKALIEVIGEDRSNAKVVIDSQTDVQESQLAESVIEITDTMTEVRITNLKGKVKIVEVILASCDGDSTSWRADAKEAAAKTALARAVKLEKKAAAEQKIVDRKKQALVKQRKDLVLKKKATAGNEEARSIKKQVSRSVAKPPLQDEEVKGERKIVRMRKMKKKENLFLSMRKKKKKKNIFLSSSSKSFKSASSFDETMSPTPSPFFDI